MLSRIFSAGAIARHIMSVTLLVGATTTMVAGSVDNSAVRQDHPDREELYGLVRACIDSGDKDSEPCKKALAASGLTPDDFYARLGKYIEAKKHENKPDSTKKPEPANSGDLEALVKDCIAKYTNPEKGPEGSSAAKEACMKAIEASGLTSREFFEKYLQPVLGKRPEPAANPQVEALVKECIAKFTEAYKRDGNGMAAKEVCTRAIEATGLTPEEFFKKFLPRTEPKPEAKPQPKPGSTTELIKKCVTMAADLNGDSSSEDIEKTAAVCKKVLAEISH